MSDTRQILVTSALPYANGSIHLGHLVEYIQTDIWSRFQKMRGRECYYVCADDAHGTAIMLKAEQLGITPEELIAQVKAEHQQDFADFLIEFDNYHSTHSEENKQFSQQIYLRLKENGHIAERSITQAFDPEKQLFLADRYIKGACPKCKTDDQYGDNCEACGATYSPTDLINPKSAISGATPVEKESTHFFFRLPEFEDFLKDWTRAGHVPPEIANKLSEWLDAGLQEWDISRDAPYFGFEIPGEKDKFFYVWLDAPIGYMASFKNLCERRGFRFRSLLAAGFHHRAVPLYRQRYCQLPRIILACYAQLAPDIAPPAKVCVHGFLTIERQKDVKSRAAPLLPHAAI